LFAALAQHLVQPLDNLLSHWQELLATRAQVQAPALAIKQLRLQLAFQFRQRHADGRLRDEEALCGGAHSARRRNGDEYLELAYADSYHQ
jgi:hypothetical protein